MAKKNNKILPFGKAIIYGMGIFGIQFFIGYINSYQSQFYVKILDANLTVCAVIILVAKILSSMADPLIGNIIDRSHFKTGKMKPYVAMSALPLAILTTLIFVKINFTSTFAMYAYITVTTIIWNIAMSFADIPSQGMLALITPNSDERSTAAGISNILKSISLALPGLVIPIVCVCTASDVIGEKQYLITALVIDVIGIVCYALMLKGTKEVVPSEPTSMSFKEMFTELKSNRNLMMILLIYILGFGRNMGMGIGVQSATVLFDHVDINALNIHLSGENLPVILGAGSAISSMLSLAVVPMINKRLGEKKTYYLFGIYGFAVSTISYLLFVFGGQAFRGVVAALLYQFFIGFMFGTHGFSPMVMLADTVDYQEMKTGKRTEGIQYAVLSLGIKISNALSVASGIFIVGISGFNAQTDYAAALANPAMPNTIMLAQWLIPGIACLLSCIPVIFYTIDKKEKAQIKEFMDKKEIAKTTVSE